MRNPHRGPTASDNLQQHLTTITRGKEPGVDTSVLFRFHCIPELISGAVGRINVACLGLNRF